MQYLAPHFTQQAPTKNALSCSSSVHWKVHEEVGHLELCLRLAVLPNGQTARRETWAWSNWVNCWFYGEKKGVEP